MSNLAQSMDLFGRHVPQELIDVILSETPTRDLQQTALRVSKSFHAQTAAELARRHRHERSNMRQLNVLTRDVRSLLDQLLNRRPPPNPVYWDYVTVREGVLTIIDTVHHNNAGGFVEIRQWRLSILDMERTLDRMKRQVTHGCWKLPHWDCGCSGRSTLSIFQKRRSWRHDYRCRVLRWLPHIFHWDLINDLHDHCDDLNRLKQVASAFDQLDPDMWVWKLEPVMWRKKQVLKISAWCVDCLTKSRCRHSTTAEIRLAKESLRDCLKVLGIRESALIIARTGHWIHSRALKKALFRFWFNNIITALQSIDQDVVRFSHVIFNGTRP